MGYEETPDEIDDRRVLGRLVQLTNEETPDEDKVGQAQFRNISLSDEQNAAYKTIKAWVDEHKRKKHSFAPLLTLGGLAGVGKTSLLGIVAADLCRELRIAFCTLTGKASGVLLRSLKANGVTPAYCGTIHRMMYVPEVDESTGAIIAWGKATNLPYDLVVVDEASMLPSSMLTDMRQCGVPVLAVGDHGQLPPVGEDSGVMAEPILRLERIHRQAMDNPILALAHLVRQGGDWRSFVKNSGDSRVRGVSAMDITELVMDSFKGFQDRSFADDPLVLCGTNRTRAMLNRAARAEINSPGLVDGDRVICLKNAYLTGMLLANGFRGKVTKISHSPNPMQINANILFPDESLQLQQGQLCKTQFGADKTFRTFTEVSSGYRSWHEVGLLIDWGFAITCHKSQGSQAAKVIVLVERFGTPDEFKRWMYTAITRSTEQLTLAL